MEKSRAIELLKLAVPIKALTQQEYSDFVEAVNMGMDALKEQLLREDTTKGTTSELIDRQAAIDGVFVTMPGATLNDVLKVLRELPPAQPEPKEGEWVLKDYLWECNKCGCRINVKNPLCNNNWNYYFCPHCGTKMKGERQK